jgi:hypothetical protein
MEMEKEKDLEFELLKLDCERLQGTDLRMALADLMAHLGIIHNTPEQKAKWRYRL